MSCTKGQIYYNFGDILIHPDRLLLASHQSESVLILNKEKGLRTMPICNRHIGKLTWLVFVFFFSTLSSWSQTVEPLITQPVDETKRTVLRGNTHPLARPEFDTGAAPADLALNHMLLVLKRSPEQEAALEKLMAEQQERSSPNYHKWLTPAEFGAQFGPSDQDIQTITSWLASHGFTIGAATKGKMTIDFSGSASQVTQAFHTAIHKYVIRGEQHWANVSDPSIPTALAPAIVGVASLHNFFPRPQSRARAAARRVDRPLYTFPAGCSETSSTNSCNYGLAPADFDKIYNVPSSLNGTGETIAIVSDSDIALSNGNPTQPSDVNAFRTIFGLPAINFEEIETDASDDPGILGPNAAGSGDEVEAVLDVEWSGAIAPNAKIDLVVSKSDSTFGGDTSASYIINNQLAPILSFSYGLCELALGNAGNQLHNTLWQQAAAEGITVLVSSGDNGSAGCDIVEVNGPAVQPAEYGLEVNGVASTPYNVAVGATDFNDPNPAKYFSTTNNPTTGQSALSYVPEMTWNDSCTNSVVIQYFQGDGYDTGTAASTCNDPSVAEFAEEDGIVLIAPTGGSGGMSNCITSNQSTPSSCAGGYPKPSWQTGPGVPNDGARDLPDLSLFGADGIISGSFYIDCEEDFVNAPCNLTTGDFVEVGGTSVSAQVMAGIMALIDQKTGSAQGNVNPMLYSLASQQSATNCNASTPATSCVFNDVTVGTIEMPCASGSPNCTVVGSNTVGVLTGYNAGIAYDLATGLGSLNVGNLVSAWGPTFYLSSSNPAVTVTSAGSSANLSVTVTAVNGFAGTVALACSGLPTGASCTFMPSASVSLTASATSATVTVTVNTTAASGLVPASRPRSEKTTPGEGPLALALLCCIALLLTYFRGIQRRSIRTALALAAFALAIAVVGCGGGGSSGGGGGGSSSGGTPAGTTTVTIAGANGNVSSVMTFQLTVQ
ncbi:MAG TPA: S53 family peptidase [Candidatus Acidoferrales bacterium]|nr:S53 family peptidase [Candidatus Acidoferrales bacterium]